MNTVSAIRAKFGSTEYYLTKMKAAELISIVGFAEEMTEWEDMTADEKMQRELNVERVITQMVPYVKDDKDRFFGSIIVDIYRGWEDIEFEPLQEVIGTLPKAYQNSIQDVGFVTFPGNGILIALDGQHRLLSLRIAIKGESGVPAKAELKPSWSKYLSPCPELGNEDVSVIFVKHEEDKKIRKIFNKINKYAKQTSRGDNIIISEDDAFAIISRRLMSPEGPLKPLIDGEKKLDIVNWRSNTLAMRSAQFTTLSSIYTITETLLKDYDINTNILPDEEQLEAYYDKAYAFWETVLEGINEYKEYMDNSLTRNVAAEYRKVNLLFKPVMQMALGHVAYFASTHNVDFASIMPLLNKIDWSFDNVLWENILVLATTKKKMITGKDAIHAAGLIISYMTMGNVMSKAEKDEVLRIICNAHDDENAELPPILVI